MARTTAYKPLTGRQTRVTSLSVHPDSLERWKREAHEQGLSLSAYVCRVVDAQLVERRAG